MKTQTSLIAILLVFLANIATPAAAITPRGRTITGTIQKVDAQTQEVEMLQADKGTVIMFVWNKRTTFVANAQIAEATILKKGAHVEVSYHEPLFGKAFVMKVTLLSAASRIAVTK